jgi:geranylgeranyl pyrophosphate synthase
LNVAGGAESTAHNAGFVMSVNDGGTQFVARLTEIAASTEALLDRLLAGAPMPGERARPERLVESMRYATLGGGKRFRPFLVVESAALFAVPRERSLMAAAALECVHCYSLVHDDLPAMDNDDLRRGRPTAHKAFDEATAILAGDSLLTFAFDILSRTETHPDPAIRIALVQALARASGLGGMAGGQMLDLAAEGRFAQAPPGEDVRDAPDVQLPPLDLSDAAVRAMIKNAEKRGYVTHREINAVLPSEEVTSDRIEAVFAILGQMGIDVVEFGAGEATEGAKWPRLGLAQVEELQAMKTGALLRFGCLAGAILGAAEDGQRHALDRFGAIIGEAFQIADDILDVEGDPQTVGKATGKDADAHKATAVAVLGVERAKQKLFGLVAEAEATLAPFGPRAAMLKAAARFVAERRA